MDNVKHPVKTVDPSISYYGHLKTTLPAIQRALDRRFANMHANLLNESDDHEDTQGESNKIDRLKAMARRNAEAC